LFKRVKEVLAGLHLSQQSLKNNWKGVTKTIAVAEFAVPVAFRG
jgi:hypothetical protein